MVKHVGGILPNTSLSSQGICAVARCVGCCIWLSSRRNKTPPKLAPEEGQGTTAGPPGCTGESGRRRRCRAARGCPARSCGWWSAPGGPCTCRGSPGGRPGGGGHSPQIISQKEDSPGPMEQKSQNPKMRPQFAPPQRSKAPGMVKESPSKIAQTPDFRHKMMQIVISLKLLKHKKKWETSHRERKKTFSVFFFGNTTCFEKVPPGRLGGHRWGGC